MSLPQAIEESIEDCVVQEDLLNMFWMHYLEMNGTSSSPGDQKAIAYQA